MTLQISLREWGSDTTSKVARDHRPLQGPGSSPCGEGQRTFRGGGTSRFLAEPLKLRKMPLHVRASRRNRCRVGSRLLRTLCVSYVLRAPLPLVQARQGKHMSDVNTRRERHEDWRQLMGATQRGDSAAYEKLLSELLPVLRQVVRRRWKNPNDVEDIVQDILLSLHGVRQTYDPRRPFMPWLMTIALRRITDAARRVSTRSKYETTVEFMPETFEGHGTKSEFDDYVDRDAIRHALSLLPEGQRRAFELMKVQGLSLAEASVLTGKTVTSLKVSVHRAIKAMQRTLE